MEYSAVAWLDVAPTIFKNSTPGTKQHVCFVSVLHLNYLFPFPLKQHGYNVHHLQNSVAVAHQSFQGIPSQIPPSTLTRARKHNQLQSPPLPPPPPQPVMTRSE